MRGFRLIAVIVAAMLVVTGCAENTERDDAGRLVLSDDFYEAIESSDNPSAELAEIIQSGKLPDGVEVEGLPDTPTERLGYFLTEVTALPSSVDLGSIIEADDAIEPLVIPALAQASTSVPEDSITGTSDALLGMASELRSTLRDGSEDDRNEVLDAHANVFGDSSDSQTVDAYERAIEDGMQDAIEDELSSLGPRTSAADVDNVVTSLGHDWITPTAELVGASYRNFCQNRPSECDGGAFEGRVDLFQRQSLVPLFMNLPENSLPAGLKPPEVVDYPARDSEEEDVWTKWLLERGLSPLSRLYDAAGQEPS